MKCKIIENLLFQFLVSNLVRNCGMGKSQLYIFCFNIKMISTYCSDVIIVFCILEVLLKS